MSTLYKRGDIYYGSIGKYRFSTGTKKKTEAQRVLQKKEQELWEYGHDLIDHSRKPMDEFFNKYSDWVSTNKRYHTARSYKSIISTFKRFLNSKRISRLQQINRSVVDDYISCRIKCSKRWTVNNHIIALKAVLNKAKEWHYIMKNPFSGYGKVEVNDSKPIKALSEEECRRFLNVCREEYSDYYPMFFAFIVTGLRAGELFTLEWSDVDFKQRLIYIRNKPGFSPKGKDNKTNRAKERIMPLHPHLAELLMKSQRLSSYVFTDQGKPFSSNKPRRLLARIAQKAGINGITRLHELRHTFASIMLSRGTHIFALKKLLGHSDLKDTQRYLQMIPEHDEAVRALVANICLVYEE